MLVKPVFALLKVKLQVFVNGFIKVENKKKSRKIFAFAGGAVLFVFLYLWMYDVLANLSQNLPVEVRLVDNFIMVVFLGFFVFLLASGITISIHYLFISTDLPLLLSSPIPEYSIFSFKLIEAIFANSSFFLFFGIPTFIAYGVVTHAAWYYYPLMLINALCFLIIPVAISFLGALIVVKFLPASRARELTAILLAVISLGIWLALQLVRASMFDRSSPDFDPNSIEQLGRISHIFLFDILPSTWAARALSGFAQGDLALIIYNFVPLLIFTALICYVSIRLSKIAFTKGMVSSEHAVTLHKRKTVQKSKTVAKRWFPDLFSSAILAVSWRDSKLFIRDSRQITNIIMIAAIMVVFPLIQETDPSATNFNLYRPYLFVIVIGALMAARLNARMIPLEEKAFWITKLTPQSGSRIIWGKYLFGFALSTILSWTAIIIVSTYYGHPLRIRLLAFCATLVLSGALSSVGLFTGIKYGQFDWEHPKQMLTSTGGFMLTVFTIVVVGIIGGIVALIYFTGNLMQLSLQFLDFSAVVIAFLFTSISAVSINYLSGKKLDRLEWRF